jgi:hypothetical protein
VFVHFLWLFTFLDDLRNMKNIFTEHPHSVGEKYFEHMLIAWKGALRLGVSSVLFIFHSFFTFVPVPKPFDLESTSDWLNSIREKRKNEVNSNH